MYENSPTLGTNKSRYISRVVDLDENIASNGIAVFADANIPSGTFVAGWIRYSIDGESDIFSKQWIPMTRVSPEFVSSSEIDFREAFFRYSLPANSPPFKAYQVRLDFGTNGSTVPVYSKTPAVRSLRTVSFIQ